MSVSRTLLKRTVSRKTSAWLKAWRSSSTGRTARTFSSASPKTAMQAFQSNGSEVKTMKLATTLSSLGARDWAECLLPTEFGDFRMRSYPSGEIVMFVGADENGRFDKIDEPVKIRIHSECVTSEIFGSVRCDCAIQLRDAMKIMKEYGKGVLVYLKQEGRGLGLHAKIQAYELQEAGLDTVEANLALGHAIDYREYTAAGKIFKDFGLHNVQLLSNNPEKINYVKDMFKKVSVAPLHPNMETVNKFPWMKKYLETKKAKCGHKLNTLNSVEVNGHHKS